MVPLDCKDLVSLAAYSQITSPLHGADLQPPHPLNSGRVVHQVAGRPCEVLHHFSRGGRGQIPTN